MRSAELGCPAIRLVARLFPLQIFKTEASLKVKPGKMTKERDTSTQTTDGPQQTMSDIVSNPLAVAAARLQKSDDSSPVQQNEELLAVSSCFEELFGYSRHELKGKSILRLLSITGMADPQLEVYLNMVEQGMKLVRGVQVSLRRKTGELVDSTVVIKKAMLPGAAGQVEEVLLFYFSELAEEVDKMKMDGCTLL